MHKKKILREFQICWFYGNLPLIILQRLTAMTWNLLLIEDYVTGFNRKKDFRAY